MTNDPQDANRPGEDSVDGSEDRTEPTERELDRLAGSFADDEAALAADGAALAEDSDAAVLGDGAPPDAFMDDDEMDFIALASEQSGMPREARAEALRSSGYSVTEISALTQRLMNAEIVIQQSCGAGLMRVNRRQ